MEQRDRVDEMLANWWRELPELATLELGIIKRVGRLAALFESAALESLAPYSVTYAEFDVLTTLRREPSPHELQPRIIAKRSSLTSGGISNIVNRLEQKGLVERRKHERDGRSALVRLTKAGIEQTLQMANATKAAHLALLDGIPQERLRALNEQLRGALIDFGDLAAD